MENTSLLVIGAGPVGLALAGDLAWRGVDSIVIEKRDGTVFQPKMDMVGVRTMEFCRRWGIADDVRAAGYNRDYVQDNAWVTNLNGLEFGREEFPAPAAEQNPPESPEHRERCPQNFFDPVLKNFAADTGRVKFMYNTELMHFAESADGVTARVRSLENGKEFDLTAAYLVGTDGGDSRVRQQLGIPMSGEGTLTHTTNAIFRTHNLEQLHKMRPAYRYIFIGPEGTWSTLVAINGRDLWRFSLIGDRQASVASEEEMRKSILRAVGRDFDFTILSVVPWERRQLVADEYRKGRVFIAGDAAHLTSPTGGFGMNTGILDAVNLSWKLAGVIQGWAGETLLDSYSIEQRPVAIRNVGEASENLRRMLAPRLSEPDPVLFDEEDDSPEANMKRREFGSEYTKAMSREWNSIGVHLGYLYDDSPVILPDGTNAPEITVSSYEQTARPGSRAPHVWLDSRRSHSMLDYFGKQFVLLVFENDVAIQELTRTAEFYSVPLRVVHIDHPESRELYQTALVLVRPDGSVAWRGNKVQDANHIILTVTGRQSITHAEERIMPNSRISI